MSARFRLEPARWPFGLGLLGLLALSAACGGATEMSSSGPTVVVVCVEALRHDYPDRASTPALDRIALEGGRAERLLPVFPANSLPNAAALATGRRAAGSGLVNNRFFDRKLDREFEGKAREASELLLARPIWESATRQGVPSAILGWPATPPTFRGAARESSLDSKAGDRDRANELVEWLSEDDAPRLILIYLEELDDVAHESGPDSDETLLAVERADRMIGAIHDAFERNRGSDAATLIVLSDHGMAPVERCIYMRAYLREKGIDALPMASGGTANLYFRSPDQVGPARKILAEDAELFRVYSPEQLPPNFGYTGGDRLGDLVLIGEPGTYFRELGGDKHPVGPVKHPGVHGFGPDRPEMHGSFYAWGSGVTAGARWGEVDLIDVYPTVCRLLGIEPSAGAEGSPIDLN